jgi:hypothetical protein
LAGDDRFNSAKGIGSSRLIDRPNHQGDQN